MGYLKMKRKVKTVDEYIHSFPVEIQNKLEKIRQTIRMAAPKAEEVISYNIPAFKKNSVLVYFAAFKNHIGFFPTSKPIEVFKKELQGYKTSKGTVHFPNDQKIPFGLITKITKYRVKEDMEKYKKK